MILTTKEGRGKEWSFMAPLKNYVYQVMWPVGHGHCAHWAHLEILEMLQNLEWPSNGCFIRWAERSSERVRPSSKSRWRPSSTICLVVAFQRQPRPMSGGEDVYELYEWFSRMGVDHLKSSSRKLSCHHCKYKHSVILMCSNFLMSIKTERELVFCYCKGTRRHINRMNTICTLFILKQTKLQQN